MNDGTNTASVALTPVAGTTYKIGGRWNAYTGKMEVAVDGTSGAEATYDGAFTLTGTDIEIGYATTGIGLFKNISFYNADKGTAFIESETT